MKYTVQKHGWDWDMRKTSIMGNWNCKMQAHARVCEENDALEEKNNTYWNNFAVKVASLKDHNRRVGRRITMIFSRIIHHSIKVLELHLVK